MLGRLGPMELAIIFAIALLIFGPRQLPKLGRTLRESIREFRKAGQELHGEEEETDVADA